jgi:hypothetical protein
MDDENHIIFNENSLEVIETLQAVFILKNLRGG